jgi:hypothetical protein
MIAGAEVAAYLEAHGVACALVGGVALAAHGIARGTLDTDLLVADPAVLEDDFWRDATGLGAFDVRRGDADDPLLGIVRFAEKAEPVDVVVGPPPWTARLLERREHVVVEGRALPVVDRADLILLKLFAGGPQDLLDVRLLLAADTPGLRQQVEDRLSEAPASVRTAWQTIAAE